MSEPRGVTRPETAAPVSLTTTFWSATTGGGRYSSAPMSIDRAERAGIAVDVGLARGRVAGARVDRRRAAQLMDVGAAGEAGEQRPDGRDVARCRSVTAVSVPRRSSRPAPKLERSTSSAAVVPSTPSLSSTTPSQPDAAPRRIVLRTVAAAEPPKKTVEV